MSYDIYKYTKTRYDFLISERVFVKIYLTSSIFILFFLSKKAYATSETIASKALPIPNNNAMPISVGSHTPHR